VSIPEDIVEEVARIFGYDNLTFVAPKIELTKSAFNAQHDVRRRIRNFLAQCGGMHEILSYPWVEDSFLEAAGISRDECLALHAGPSPKASLLQPTRIPSLLGAIKLNRSHVQELSLFEVANVFSPQGRSSQSGEGEVLPYQKQVVAGAVVSENRQDSFLKTRGIVEELFRSLPFGEVIFNPDRSPPRWVHVDTGLVIELKKSGEKVGRMGLIAGTTLFKSGIKHCSASAFEIDIDTILGLKRINQAYEAIPKYPVVDFDLAVLLSIETPWAVVEEQVLSADKLVTSVSFLNEYRGEQVPGGKKSVALRYTLCDPKATLSSKQVNKVADKIIAKLKKAVGAEMRAG
jgi:phenylalanyl-tRNA synthetase beta chain